MNTCLINNIQVYCLVSTGLVGVFFSALPLSCMHRILGTFSQPGVTLTSIDVIQKGEAFTLS